MVKALAEEPELLLFIKANEREAVASREETGVGFVSTVRFSARLPKTTASQWDWNFSHHRLTHGGSFICFRDGDDGLVVEGVAHVGEWPRFDRTDFFDE